HTYANTAGTCSCREPLEITMPTGSWSAAAASLDFIYRCGSGSLEFCRSAGRRERFAAPTIARRRTSPCARGDISTGGAIDLHSHKLLLYNVLSTKNDRLRSPIVSE